MAMGMMWGVPLHRHAHATAAPYIVTHPHRPDVWTAWIDQYSATTVNVQTADNKIA